MEYKFEAISSKQNPRIKNLLHLQKHSERVKQNLFLIEGLKETEKALHSDYKCDSFFFCPEIIDRDKIYKLLNFQFEGKTFELTREIFNKLAYRKDSGGVLLLARPKDHNLDKLVLPDNPLLLIIEGIEKPGNIGAIYRTADAAGISAIIICDPGTDLYNPNTLRASLGCVFTIPTAISANNETIEWLKNRKIKIYTSYLQAAIPYYEANFCQAAAIVMGTESTGVTDIWLNSSDANIIIPMQGQADSMNVSTAAAVLIFEARRQRDFK
jgi:TrmH family RNA methyltransferase